MNIFPAVNENGQIVNIGYLSTYHKYWSNYRARIVNPKFYDGYSWRILDLKEESQTKQSARDQAIDYFIGQIPLILPSATEFYFCGAPSSKAGTFNGIFYLIEEFCRRGSMPNAFKANNLIIRQYTIQSAHLGGPRNIQIQKNSMALNDSIDIRGREIVVIDDVVTTGSTLIACQELLLQGGAAKVDLLALGKTTE
jgi:hypothetical protein